ncbi:DNA polymerase III subunit gamma/tau [Legionella dresdenensis]|uniref:DNA polymerase III subunit gamma/tau n=1 Tax=Legionella dresdenensis TaxID=450200 RepID=A0ABV8CEV5_9GAMM
MSYLALARKWRPRTFAQLVGQEHINKALIKSLNQKSVHHAYLFTGTRGVGKTSIARLMAKALNCEHGPSADPCLSCDACQAVEDGRFIDLIEIDAASRTRVEDTRELLENVQYAPAVGQYKIYLIDEVHMLSQHSFNALLKTLEEPPPHVKFLLATTDPQKLPVTVLSRCLQFNLRHLQPETINAHLQFILKEENYPFEPEAVQLLAKAAHGSMRDALSMLDQAIASSEKCLTAQDIKSMLGYTQQDFALQLLHALSNHDAARIITICRQIAAESGHFSYALEQLLNYLHQITLCQALADCSALIDRQEDITPLAQRFTPEDVQLFYQIALKGSEDLALAPSPLIGFEMTLLRMLAFKPASEAVLPKLAYEAAIPDNDSPHSIACAVPEIEPEIPDSSVDEPELEIAACSEFDDVGSKRPNLQSETAQAAVDIVQPASSESSWSAILDKIKLTGLARNAAENAEMIGKDGRDISLRVAQGHQSLFTPNVTSRLEQALAAYFGEPIKINFEFDTMTQSSPAQQKQVIQTQNQQKAEESIIDDPFVKRLQQEFSAEIVKNSIAPLKDEL